MCRPSSVSGKFFIRTFQCLHGHCVSAGADGVWIRDARLVSFSARSPCVKVFASVGGCFARS